MNVKTTLHWLLYTTLLSIGIKSTAPNEQQNNKSEKH